MQQRICLFPGSFDPITNGHVDIIKRSLNLFDKLVVGIGVNVSKVTTYSIEQRVNWIKDIFKDNVRIEVTSYEGLTVNYCKTIGAKFILRGMRCVSDFEYEKSFNDINRQIEPEIEMVFLISSPSCSMISSTMVRDLIRNERKIDALVPAEIITSLFVPNKN